MASPRSSTTTSKDTDRTFGFDTAVSIVTEAIDRLHTTAEAHQRVVVVEVMGRHTGWIATVGGLAGGADCIPIPEHPMTIEEICDIVKKRHARGRLFSIVVVAEGFKLKGASDIVTQDPKVDQFGHIHLGGIGEVIGQEIEKRTGFETRVTVLGHVQRGGSPTAFDRLLGTRYGVKAVDLIHAGKFGQMVVLRGNNIADVLLEKTYEGTEESRPGIGQDRRDLLRLRSRDMSTRSPGLTGRNLLEPLRKKLRARRERRAR